MWRLAEAGDPHSAGELLGCAPSPRHEARIHQLLASFGQVAAPQ